MVSARKAQTISLIFLISFTISACTRVAPLSFKNATSDTIVIYNVSDGKIYRESPCATLRRSPDVQVPIHDWEAVRIGPGGIAKFTCVGLVGDDNIYWIALGETDSVAVAWGTIVNPNKNNDGSEIIVWRPKDIHQIYEPRRITFPKKSGT